MKRDNTKLAALFAASLILVSALFSSCGGEKPAETTAVTTEDITTAAPAPTAPQYTNPLTGLETTKELANQRPVAISIGNTQAALPQNGIGQADVLVELPYEGGLTRLLMVKQDYASLGKVGSVRSARDYSVRFSQDFNSLNIHGGSDTDGKNLALNAIRFGFKVSYQIKKGLATSVDDCPSLRSAPIDNFDAINDSYLWYKTDMFYRDDARIAANGYEHSVVTSGKGILEGIKFYGTTTEITSNFPFPYSFVDYFTERTPKTSGASTVTIPHSYIHSSVFKLDGDTGDYLRWQYTDMPHIDGNTGEQLSFKNLLILFHDVEMFPGDAKYRLDVEYVGSGEGYYISNGGYETIKWRRSAPDEVISILDSDGATLEINRGKTYICVIDEDEKPYIVFE